MNPKIPLLLCTLLLAACASTQVPPLPPDHPANPAAPQSAWSPAHYSLGTDATTRATHSQLATAKKETQDSGGMQGMDMKEMNH